MYSEDKKRELIMKHYSTPSHKGSIEGIAPVEQHSKRCVDNATIYVELDGDVIKDIKHESEGCAVYLSSMDIVADQLIGKTKEEAIKILDNYQSMINGSDYSEELIKDLAIYNNVGKQLNRAECALTTAYGYEKTLKG